MNASAERLEPLPAPRTVGVFSPGIARIPDLAALLGAERVVFRPGPMRRCDVVVGWGKKPNTQRGRRYAARHGLPFLALEDGFLRSVGLGVEGDPPLSIVADDLGIYYDATAPSRLEAILANDDLSTLTDRARRERTEDEYKELFATAGFELERIIPTRSAVSIIIGRPA